VTLDCRGYGTPSVRGIPLTSRYRNVSLSRGKSRTAQRPTHLLFLTISKTSNIWYNWRDDSVRALARPHPIWMFYIKTVGIISSLCLCNGRRGRLLFEQRWWDSTKKGGTGLTALDAQR
jgi:hypothetical protein